MKPWDPSALPLLIAECCFLASCAHTPKYEGWSAMCNNSGLVLYTRDGRSQLGENWKWLARAHHVFRNSFLRDTSPPIVEVVDWETFDCGSIEDAKCTGPSDQVIPANDEVCGGNLGAQGVAVAVKRWGKSDIVESLAWHMTERSLPHAPLWATQGLNSYLSRFGVSDDGSMACFGAGQLDLWSRTDVHVLVPVHDLLSADHHRYRGSMTVPERMRFDGSSWTFVDYLVRGDRVGAPARFVNLIGSLRRGAVASEALKVAYPEIRIDELDAKLSEHLRLPRPAGELCPVRLPLPMNRSLDQVVKDRSVSPREMSCVFSRLRDHRCPKQSQSATAARVPNNVSSF